MQHRLARALRNRGRLLLRGEVVDFGGGLAIHRTASLVGPAGY